MNESGAMAKRDGSAFLNQGRKYGKENRREVCRVSETYAIELKNITKRFGKVVANDKVNMSVKRGEILSVLGENGSGKTTLMNMISGIYYPDEGQILVNGKEVTICSPKDSFALGIGMIHQHFKLVDVLTAAENIILGLPGKEILDMKSVHARIRQLTEKYGFELDPEQKIYTMSVSQKQTVEIVKLLYRGVDILILDEPTAVLTPQETEKLFAVLRNMRAAGHSIIIITHKLHEVLTLSDRVAVLRKGQYIGTVQTSEATEETLTEMMVGKKVSLNIERPDPVNPEKRLEVSDVTCVNKEGVTTLDHVSFQLSSGEILGIAGIAGSGQRELLESIAGLQPMMSGSITYYPPEGGNENLAGMSTAEIRRLGIKLSFVPEDRLGMGLVGAMGMTGNMMLRGYRNGKSIFTDRKTPKELAEHIIQELEVVTPGVNTPVRKLSGGNVQKVLVGREIATNPRVLMVAYPVRGLDINSSYTIYHLLNEQKRQGAAVICVGEDLDVLLELCDRILVLCGGRVSGIVDGRTATKEQVGLMIRIAAILLSLVVCAIVIVLLTDLNPIEVYKGIFDGAVGTKRRTWMTIRDTLVLLCIAVGITPAFKMRFWNIGAEGQVLIGGVTSAAMMIYLGNSLPPLVLFPLMLLGSAMTAMVWAAIPAFFKAHWNTNETLFTLMMNYLAMQVITYCIIFWENPKGSNSVGTINSSTKGGWLPELFGMEYGWNLVIVFVITIAMYVYLKYSKQGYEISVVGESENTARYAGINVKRVIIRTMALSGAICGIAGFIIVSGASHTISTSTAGGRGFTAIIVSWLSKFNSFVMILVSFFLVFMQKGAGQIASQFKLNENASDVITGIILFFILGCEFFINYKVGLRSRRRDDRK